MISVQVMGLAMMRDNAPVLLLRETAGERRSLVIAVGAPEAQALVAAQQGIRSQRPSTIELLADMVTSFGSSVEQVEVTELADGIFISDLVLGDGVRVSARPSDAIALALRADAPVSVDESVLDEAGTHLQLETEGETSEVEPDVGQEADQEAEVEQFRSFLDEISPEDFGEQSGGSP